MLLLIAMFRKIIGHLSTPIVVVGVTTISDYTKCNPYSEKKQWKVADKNKIMRANKYVTTDHTFSKCRDNWIYNEKDVVKNFNTQTKYLCKINCGHVNIYDCEECNVTHTFPLIKKNGIYIPRGLDQQTKDRMIVSQDINRFKDMEHTKDLCEFVYNNWPSQIVHINIGKCKLKDVGLSWVSWKYIEIVVENDKNVYKLLEKTFGEFNNQQKERLSGLNGSVIQYIDNPTENMKINAVKNKPAMIKFIDNPSIKIQEAAVNKDHRVIKFINNPGYVIQKKVITKEPNFIKNIIDPDEKLQLIAVKTKPDVIKYIKNPTDNVCSVAYVRNYNSLKHMNKIPRKVIVMILNDNPSLLKLIPDNRFPDFTFDYITNYSVFEYIPSSSFTQTNILKLISNTSSVTDLYLSIKKYNDQAGIYNGNPKIKITPMIYRAMVEKDPLVLNVLPLNYHGAEKYEKKVYQRDNTSKKSKRIIKRREQKRKSLFNY